MASPPSPSCARPRPGPRSSCSRPWPILSPATGPWTPAPTPTSRSRPASSRCSTWPWPWPEATPPTATERGPAGGTVRHGAAEGRGHHRLLPRRAVRRGGGGDGLGARQRPRQVHRPVRAGPGLRPAVVRGLLLLRAGGRLPPLAVPVRAAPSSAGRGGVRREHRPVLHGGEADLGHRRHDHRRSATGHIAAGGGPAVRREGHPGDGPRRCGRLRGNRPGRAGPGGRGTSHRLGRRPRRRRRGGLGVVLRASKRARRTMGTVEYQAAMTLVAAVVLTPVALVHGGRLAGGWGTWGWVVLLATVPGGGHFLMNWAHEHISLAVASLLNLATPVVAMAGAALLLGERVTALQMVGTAVTLVALAAVILDQRGGPLPAEPVSAGMAPAPLED